MAKSRKTTSTDKAIIKKPTDQKTKATSGSTNKGSKVLNDAAGKTSRAKANKSAVTTAKPKPIANKAANKTKPGTKSIKKKVAASGEKISASRTSKAGKTTTTSNATRKKTSVSSGPKIRVSLNDVLKNDSADKFDIQTLSPGKQKKFQKIQGFVKSGKEKIEKYVKEVEKLNKDSENLEVEIVKLIRSGLDNKRKKKLIKQLEKLIKSVDKIKKKKKRLEKEIAIKEKSLGKLKA